jgi:hypothetical protein
MVQMPIRQVEQPPPPGRVAFLAIFAGETQVNIKPTDRSLSGQDYSSFVCLAPLSGSEVCTRI